MTVHFIFMENEQNEHISMKSKQIKELSDFRQFSRDSLPPFSVFLE